MSWMDRGSVGAGFKPALAQQLRTMRLGIRRAIHQDTCFESAPCTLKRSCIRGGCTRRLGPAPMPIDPRKGRNAARSLRLPGYDYSQAGAYFITACIHNRAMLFGEVIDGDVRLSEMGTIVQQAWDDLPTHHIRGIELDASSLVMPNHVHRNNRSGSIIQMVIWNGATPSRKLRRRRGFKIVLLLAVV